MRKKLDEQRVLAMVPLFSFHEITDQDIADLFKISKNQVNHIRNGYRWNSITNIKPVEQETNTTTSFDDYLQKLEKDNLKNMIQSEIINYIANFK